MTIILSTAAAIVFGLFQEPASVTISTRFLESSGTAPLQISAKGPIRVSGSLKTFENVDELKLVSNKNLKTVSAPIVRTLDRMAAEMKVTGAAPSYLKVTPTLGKSTVDLEVLVGKTPDPADLDVTRTFKVRYDEPLLLVFERKDKSKLILMLKASRS